VLPGADDDQARTLAERIRQAVQAEAIVHPRAPHAGVVTVSAGVASAVPQSLRVFRACPSSAPKRA